MALRRVWRYGLSGLAVVVVLVIAAGAMIVSRFDPNSIKPQLVAAVAQATGRTLTLNGPVGLKISLWPTVTLQDVALANPAGFTQPNMATAQRLELQVAVLPLLRRQVVIDRLVLVRPDIVLERNEQGERNWQFAPAAPPGGAAKAGSADAGATPGSGSPPPATSVGASRQAGASGEASTGPGIRIGVHGVQIEDGNLTWHDDRAGRSVAFAVQSLIAKAASAGTSMQLAVRVAYDGTPFALDGQVGPLSRLLQSPIPTRRGL